MNWKLKSKIKLNKNFQNTPFIIHDQINYLIKEDIYYLVGQIIQ